MDGVCRTCMSSKKPVRSLFEVDSDLIELHVKLYTCFPTFNFDDSDFPKTMCAPCIKKLQSAYKFRELCLKSTSVFLKNRKNKNVHTKKGAAKSDLELNTKYEKTCELDAPNIISTSDISEQTDSCPTPNKLISSDTTELHLSVPLTNNSNNELDTKNKLVENEKNMAPQSVSVDSDSASNETSENSEILNTVYDENTNKEFIKVYPLDSTQTENSPEAERSVEKEIIDVNSEQDKQSTISTPTPVQNDIDTNIEKDTEVQEDNNDTSSKDLFIYQDSNSLDILINDQVYRINLIDGNETSSKCQLLNEIEKTRSEENYSYEICFEQTENYTENNFSFIGELKNQSKQNTEIMNNETKTNVPEQDTNSSDDETSLLRPLQDYHLNNFITSSLAYKEEQQLEQTEIHDETDVKVNIKDSAIHDTISEHENYFDFAANEIEFPTNLPEENIHPIFELKIECVRTLNEDNNNMANVENSQLDVEGYPTKSFVNDKPFIAPVPIAKLMSCSQNNEYEPDEIDDLVNKNVTEVFDYNNHDDHTYAKLRYIKTVPISLPINYVKRKRKIPAKFKMSEELELNRPKLKELKQNLKEIKSCLNSKGQTKPVTIVKRRRRRKLVDKVTDVLTETDTSSNLVQSSDVPPGSLINNTVFRGVDVDPQKINENMVMRVPMKRIVDGTISNALSENVAKNTLDADKDVPAKNTVKNLRDTDVPHKNIAKNLPDMNVLPKNIVNTNLSPKSRVKRPYGTRSSFIPDVTNSNTYEHEKNVEWKVKKVRPNKNNLHPFRLKLKNIAVKTKRACKKIKPNEKVVGKAKKSKEKGITNSKTEIPEPKHIQEEKTTTEIEASEQKNILVKTNHKIETSIRGEETEKEVPFKKIEPQINNKNETSTSTDFTSMTLNKNEVRIDKDLEYPYECDLCNFRTNLMANLEKHLVTHLDENTKSFTCKYCKKSFSNIVGYKIHQTRVHKNLVSETQDSFYTCKICFKVFSSVKSCSKHKRVHKLQK